MQLKMEQKQAQILSPQMIQSMQVLQMNVQELREYIEQAVIENPMLELYDQTDDPRPAPGAAEELVWLASSDWQNASYYHQDSEDTAYDPLSHFAQTADGEDELNRYILSQFLGMDLEPEVMEAIRFLLSQLDEKGWLRGDTAAFSSLSGIPEDIMARALTELQSAEPAGVGARNLSECLQLQIERWAGDHWLVKAIAEHHLPDLARGRYRRIAQALNAPEDEVRSTCDFLRTLNPRPSMGFASHGHLAYIVPDVEIMERQGHFELVMNDGLTPQLTMNAYYLDLLQHTEDETVRTYLTQKADQARAVLSNIERRRGTFLRCARYMAERQEEFFRLGPRYLAPLSMEQTAEHLELHVSTVSRAVRDKYMQCRWGVYPLSYLFSRSIGEKEVSSEAAKKLLKDLIGEEDKPLSDQKLCDEMARRGCPISRRTVAKYREELNIPAAAARKR